MTDATKPPFNPGDRVRRRSNGAIGIVSHCTWTDLNGDWLVFVGTPPVGNPWHQFDLIGGSVVMTDEMKNLRWKFGSQVTYHEQREAQPPYAILSTHYILEGRIISPETANAVRFALSTNTGMVYDKATQEYRFNIPDQPNNETLLPDPSDNADNPASGGTEGHPDMGDVAKLPNRFVSTDKVYTTYAADLVGQILSDPAAVIKLADAIEDARFNRAHNQRTRYKEGM